MYICEISPSLLYDHTAAPKKQSSHAENCPVSLVRPSSRRSRELLHVRLQELPGWPRLPLRRCRPRPKNTAMTAQGSTAKVNHSSLSQRRRALYRSSSIAIRLWSKLSDGGQMMQCVCLTDRFGITWQMIPSVLRELLHDNTPQKSQRVMKAMMQMAKLDIAELQEAYEQA